MKFLCWNFKKKNYIVPINNNMITENDYKNRIKLLEESYKPLPYPSRQSLDIINNKNTEEQKYSYERIRRSSFYNTSPGEFQYIAYDKEKMINVIEKINN